jgi:hypothetical protein
MEKEIIAREITNWLNQESVRNRLNGGKNIVNIAFHHMVRWYPQISNNGMDTYGLGLLDKLTNWRLSSRAHDAILERAHELPINAIRAELNNAFRSILHPEHNVPVKVKKQELINLVNPDIERVRESLEKEYEVILITKKEASVLNGRRNCNYQLDQQIIIGCGLSSSGSYAERLHAIEAVIIPERTKENLIEYLRGHFPNL